MEKTTKNIAIINTWEQNSFTSDFKKCHEQKVIILEECIKNLEALLSTARKNEELQVNDLVFLVSDIQKSIINLKLLKKPITTNR